MTQSISFFKTIKDGDLDKKIDFSRTEYELSYEDKGKSIPLRMDSKDGILLISDDSRQWDMSEHGLILKFAVSLGNTKLLFEEGGIADHDSVIGLAMICSSTVSDRLEAFPLCSFTSKNDGMTSDCSVSLSKGKFRGNAILSIVLYLVKSGKIKSTKPNHSGTIFGNLDSCSVKLFENDTLFPTYEVEKPGMPLWWVSTQWSDIENDPFLQENVSVIINRSSKDYCRISLGENNDDFSPVLLAEIMSSSISVIVEKLRSNNDDWDKINSESTYPRGSIAFIVQYMRDTLAFDFSTPESLALSIREYVYSKMRLI